MVAGGAMKSEGGDVQIKIAVAIVVAAIILAGTIAVVFRYEMSAAYRLDRWTGQVRLCEILNGRIECPP